MKPEMIDSGGVSDNDKNGDGLMLVLVVIVE